MKIENKKSLLYVTTASEKEADKIAMALVEEQLVACANILSGASTIYRWKGKMNKETEVVLILKTIAKLVHKSVKRIKELHSYECPAIIVMDVRGGNKEFLNWIDSSVVQDPEG